MGGIVRAWVSIPSRGFWFFEVKMLVTRWKSTYRFQSPRGDFGFLKALERVCGDMRIDRVSTPSRGFWFFEGVKKYRRVGLLSRYVSIPSRGFWFFEVYT